MTEEATAPSSPMRGAQSLAAQAKHGMFTWFTMIEAMKMDIKKGTDLACPIVGESALLLMDLVPGGQVEIIQAAKAYVMFHHGIINPPAFIPSYVGPMAKRFPKKDEYPWTVRL